MELVNLVREEVSKTDTRELESHKRVEHQEKKSDEEVN